MASPAPLPVERDPVMLVQAAALLLGRRVVDDAVDAGCHALRASDGYVFQRLVPEPATIQHLADGLGITQQGTSKLVTDLERRGFVERRLDPDDARRRLVALTDKGWLAVETARRVRRRIERDLRRRHGDATVDAALTVLHDLVVSSGGLEAIAGRRLRAPD